jgi:hypothetical protein
MNRLDLARRTQIISCLVEGNSIRSTERMTDTHRDTVMRLMIEVGEGCKTLLDAELRNLSCKRIHRRNALTTRRSVARPTSCPTLIDVPSGSVISIVPPHHEPPEADFSGSLIVRTGRNTGGNSGLIPRLSDQDPWAPSYAVRWT